MKKISAVILSGVFLLSSQQGFADRLIYSSDTNELESECLSQYNHGCECNGRRYFPWTYTYYGYSDLYRYYNQEAYWPTRHTDRFYDYFAYDAYVWH